MEHTTTQAEIKKERQNLRSLQWGAAVAASVAGVHSARAMFQAEAAPVDKITAEKQTVDVEYVPLKLALQSMPAKVASQPIKTDKAIEIKEEIVIVAAQRSGTSKANLQPETAASAAQTQQQLMEKVEIVPQNTPVRVFEQVQLSAKNLPVVAQKAIETQPATETKNEDTVVAGGEYTVVAGGEDTVVAGGEDTVVAGGEDTVVGGGEDTVVAGGEDTVVAGGEDTVVAGGEDTVVGGGEDTVVAGGEDTVVAGGEDTVVAGGEDTVVGGGEDTVVAGGEDTVVAGGEDTVVAGGEDTVVAGGEDTVVAGGEDTVVAGGEDTVVAGGEDTVVAGGEDTISGGGDDIEEEEDGEDAEEDSDDDAEEEDSEEQGPENLVLKGSEGNDELKGGEGDDQFYGFGDEGVVVFQPEYFTSIVDSKLEEPKYGNKIAVEEVAEAGDYAIVDPRSLTANQLTFVGNLNGDAIFRVNNANDFAVKWTLYAPKGEQSFDLEIPANSAAIVNAGAIGEKGMSFKVSGEDAPKSTATSNGKTAIETTEGGVQEIKIGDTLIGGEGKDQFFYQSGQANVDLILDFSEGDQLVLQGFDKEDISGFGTTTLLVHASKSESLGAVLSQHEGNGNGHIWTESDVLFG